MHSYAVNAPRIAGSFARTRTSSTPCPPWRRGAPPSLARQLRRAGLWDAWDPRRGARLRIAQAPRRRRLGVRFRSRSPPRSHSRSLFPKWPSFAAPRKPRVAGGCHAARPAPRLLAHPSPRHHRAADPFAPHPDRPPRSNAPAREAGVREKVWEKGSGGVGVRALGQGRQGLPERAQPTRGRP